MSASALLSLPTDILLLLPEYLHNVEDHMNLASTCTALRDCMRHTAPNALLRLAEAQSRIFFRPSPHFLVAATANELGEWARQSDANEDLLAVQMQHGVEGLLELALQHCGLTMARIRDLHLLRFSVVNPITDLIDKCVGRQWYSTPNFWDGGVDDAYTIDSDPPLTYFQLAIYGELFAPDLEAALNQDGSRRRLKVNTRLEFVKYCVPDIASIFLGRRIAQGSEAGDSRRAVMETGPYAKGTDGKHARLPNNNIALTWVLSSSRWRPYWKALRARAGPDFDEAFDDGWWYDENDQRNWRQRLWENVMVSQGLEGLGMIRPELQDQWVERIREWREKISKIDTMPEVVKVGRQATHRYPYLLGDLRICVSGYVAGT